MARSVYLLLVQISLFTCGIGAQSPTYNQNPHFETVANYLTQGSGKWRGANAHYNADNPRSPKAFGLWFERPMKNLLTLTIVAYQKDTTVISSQGIFTWHPQKRQFLHMMSDRGHGYAEGVTEFPNDSSFISTMKIYRPNGKVYDHKDVNYLVNQNEHRNTSYSMDENGEWIETGKWIWKRDPE